MATFIDQTVKLTLQPVAEPPHPNAPVLNHYFNIDIILLDSYWYSDNFMFYIHLDVYQRKWTPIELHHYGIQILAPLLTVVPATSDVTKGWWLVWLILVRKMPSWFCHHFFLAFSFTPCPKLYPMIHLSPKFWPQTIVKAISGSQVVRESINSTRSPYSKLGKKGDKNCRILYCIIWSTPVRIYLCPTRR